MEDIKIKEKIYYKSFSDYTDFRIFILSFIKNYDLNKIIYKGNSSLIQYKELKKIVLEKNHLKNKSSKILKESVYSIYNDVCSKAKNEPYCVIYKKK